MVENNYGYQDPFGPTTGALTEPGFARVDVRRGGRGCRKVWETFTERAPSVVPKLSAQAGLIYTYTRDPDPNGTQPWFWTAISLRTGQTAFKRYAGNGLSFNNNYAGIGIARDGSAYLGVIGGIVEPAGRVRRRTRSTPGRIPTAVAQIKSLALWTAELRGRRGI